MAKVNALRPPFNRPQLVGKELDNTLEATELGILSSGGAFSGRCEDRPPEMSGVSKVLPTYPCSAALEMTVILADVQPGEGCGTFGGSMEAADKLSSCQLFLPMSPTPRYGKQMK